ncbi:MAG TPA: GLUG motif-containing protein [Rhizomicrobium sp.]|nr:GLUG motif-containing protein [Rhizomicrobium sp.]
MSFHIRLLAALAVALGGMTSAANAALVISDAPTSGVNCAAGVCTATAANAVLNAKSLKKLLVATDMKVVSGSAAQDIVFNAKFQWTKPTRLTLDAYRAIIFKLAVVAEGTGGVTLITNDGGTGGDYSFTDKGKLTFWDTSSSLIINGTPFTLVNSIDQIAQNFAGTNPAYVALSNYFAASGTTFKKSPVHQLNGTFEGLGHVIDHMAITGENGKQAQACTGLFYTAAGGSIIRDIHLTNVNILSTKGRDVGAIIGCGGNSAILGSSAQGSITATRTASVGGLVGFASSIVNSSAAMTINTNTGELLKREQPYVGGLAGYADSITGSHASGTISASANEYAGGLVGYGITISLSSASTSVNLPDGTYKCTQVKHRRFPSLGGGLAGIGEIVDRSFATGAVTGGHSAVLGGLVGDAYYLSNSYSTGSVTGGVNSCIGGLIGYAEPVTPDTGITSSYAVGAVSTAGPYTPGGLAAFVKNGSLFASDVWDLDTTGISDTSHGAGNVANVSGITGLSDAALKSGLPSGFDPAVWGQSAGTNNGYPYLLANPPQ